MKREKVTPLLKIAITLFAMLLAFSLVQVADARLVQSEEDMTIRDNGLRFLTDVARLNLSSYDIDVQISDTAPVAFAAKQLGFNLTSAESNIRVNFMILDTMLFWFKIYPNKGSPTLIEPASSDILSTAKDTLDRLQAFSAKEYLPTMRSTLDTVTKLENSKATIANFTQEITVSGSSVRISWEPYNNGLSNQQNKLYLEFEDGCLIHYSNWLGIHERGSSDVKISEQEAIQIAMEHARAYSWTQGNETISNVNVLDKPVLTSISLQNRGTNNTLYPLWDIHLPLDKMYPGGVTGFHVLLWADTGEVSSITPIGFGGNPNASPSESTETTAPSTQTGPDYGIAVAITLVAATIISASCLIYKRKRQQN
jgi:hypothetical protein